jgi:hypothetical protein
MAEQGQQFNLPLGEGDEDAFERLFFRQRCALAVFYYATGCETSWNERCNFLTQAHVCNWTCPLPNRVIEYYSNYDALLFRSSSSSATNMGVQCYPKSSTFTVDIVSGVELSKLFMWCNSLKVDGFTPLGADTLFCSF